MNVVDSSGWLEYYADGPNAQFFSRALEDFDTLLIPSISIYEVHKYARRQAASHPVQRAVAQMERGHVIFLDPDIAKLGAELSLELGLPMADSLILATARAHDALLWTQDSDFKGISNVEYREKKIFR